MSRWVRTGIICATVAGLVAIFHEWTAMGDNANDHIVVTAMCVLAWVITSAFLCAIDVYERRDVGA